VKHLLIILFSFISISCTSSSSSSSTTSTDNTTTSFGIKQLGTSSSDFGKDVTTDSSGNIYVTGDTLGDLDGNTNSGSNDIFLVKYDSTGTKQWTKQLGTSGYDYGQGVTTDSSDNIYVTGYTTGGLDGNTNSGGKDIFLVKYNSSGTKRWTKQLGTSSGDESGQGVTTDSLDNIYVTGDTLGDLDGNISSGYSDIFLVKYNSSGTKQWTKQLGTSSGDEGNGVSTDLSDNIYVFGTTYGGLDGNTNSGGRDIFLVKYNSSGTKQWTKQLGTPLSDFGKDVTTDSSGNIYVTGSTNGGLDGNTNSCSTCGSTRYYDIILIKYNSSGTKQWTKQLGNTSDDFGKDVTTDSSGNIYVIGDNYESLSGGLDGNNNSGSYDIVLIKYNSSGTKQWTKQLGTSGNDYGQGVTTDSSDNIYMTGYTRSVNGVGLDGNPISYSWNIFLIKYDSSGTIQ